jgi:hypothetical protein
VVRQGNPKAGVSAICALVLTCALVPMAAASQGSTDTASSKKPATSKPTAKPQETTSTSSKKSSGTHTASGKHSTRKKKTARVRGQQKIDSERAQAIQEALIRQHYLSGDATGTWNEASEEAMRHYQSDNGWQSKTVPDSRALIKLGLGPSKDHLLNPESAMTTVPDAPKAEPIPTTSNSAPAGSNSAAPASPASNSGSPQ